VSEHASPIGASADNERSILIVEDDPGAVEIFEQILTLHGYGVRVARDAESGLMEIQRDAPAVVLLDLHLPTADGLEFLRQLRASAPHARMPTAVMTGDYFLDEDVARELGTLGAKLYFKPLWEEDLLRLVHELLSGICGSRDSRFDR
jgi:DNA-binding response OmpR family regulator